MIPDELLKQAWRSSEPARVIASSFGIDRARLHKQWRKLQRAGEIPPLRRPVLKNWQSSSLPEPELGAEMAARARLMRADAEFVELLDRFHPERRR